MKIKSEEEAIKLLSSTHFYKEEFNDWRSNAKVAFKALDMNMSNILFCSNSLKNTKKFFKYILNKNCYEIDSILLSYASDKIRDDYEIAFLSVRKNAHNYLYLSDKLKNDNSICLAALQNSISIYPYLSKPIVENKAFITNFLLGEKNNGYILKYLPKHLKEDQEILKLSLHSNPFVFKEIYSLGVNKEMFLNLLKKDYNLLKEMDLNFLQLIHKDKQFKENICNILNIDLNIINDKEKIITCLKNKKNEKIYKISYFLNNDILNDDNLIIELIKSDLIHYSKGTLEYLLKDKNEEKIKKKIIDIAKHNNNWLTFFDIPPNINNDKNFISDLACFSMLDFQQVHSSLKSDKKFILDLVYNDSIFESDFKELPIELISDKEFILECIKHNSNINFLHYSSDNIKKICQNGEPFKNLQVEILKEKTNKIMNSIYTKDNQQEQQNKIKKI